jgi:Na+/H+ antiporter NhaD/arsenite permease-like protein
MEGIMNLNYSTIPYVLLICLIFNITSLAQTAGNPDTILPGPRAQVETPIAINPTDQ